MSYALRMSDVLLAADCGLPFMHSCEGVVRIRNHKNPLFHPYEALLSAHNRLSTLNCYPQPAHPLGQHSCPQLSTGPLFTAG